MITDSPLLKDAATIDNLAVAGFCNPLCVNDVIFDDGFTSDTYDFQLTMHAIEWYPKFKLGKIYVLFNRIMSDELYSSLYDDNFLEYVNYLISNNKDIHPFNSVAVDIDFTYKIIRYVQGVFGAGVTLPLCSKVKLSFHVMKIHTDQLIKNTVKNTLI